MLAKVCTVCIVKAAIACREVNYTTDTIKIREDSRNRDNRNIMAVICSRTSRTDSRKVSNLVGKPATAAELTTRTLSNSSRDNRNIADVNSRRETRKSKDARNRRNNSNGISRDANKSSERRKICEERRKKDKNSLFFPR
jgi:hypothetical protein